MTTKKKSASRANESESNREQPATSVQPVEPSAKDTGGGLIRQREAVRGNTEAGAGELHPELPAGQHATGSFTGENPARTRKRNGQR